MNRYFLSIIPHSLVPFPHLTRHLFLLSQSFQLLLNHTRMTFYFIIHPLHTLLFVGILQEFYTLVMILSSNLPHRLLQILLFYRALPPPQTFHNLNNLSNLVLHLSLLVDPTESRKLPLILMIIIAAWCLAFLPLNRIPW